MSDIRRALLLMTADRYLSMAVNFILIAVLSRLLTPDEIGVSVIGASVMAVALAVREFASAGYLIQKPEITEHDKQTLATLLTALGLALAAACWLLAPHVEQAYGRDGVGLYLRLCAVGLIFEGVSTTLTAYMRRDLAFGKVALVNVTNLLVGAVITCSLAAHGFSFIAFGIGWVCSSFTAAVVAFALKPDLAIFRPSLRNWREFASFGAYNGLAALLSRAYDSIPLLLFGKIMGLAATGTFFRAFSICQLPDKMFLAGVLQVALPALSRAAAAGQDMKAVYLRGVQQITALYWPTLAMTAMLAHPIVDLLLGPQWAGVVPLVQIMSLAWMFAFSNELFYSLLVSLGGIRDHLLRNAIIWPVSGAILIAASFKGPEAAAFGLAVAMPIQWLVSFLILRRRLPIAFAQMGAALLPSGLVTVATVTGPLLVIWGLLGGSFRLGLGEAAGLGALSGVCWLSALAATRHPLLPEVQAIARRVGELTRMGPRRPSAPKDGL